MAVVGDALSNTALLVLYAAAFLPWAAALPGAEAASISSWWFVAAGGAIRAFLIPASPIFSDDIYRYVWDGRVGLAGINPFVHPPSSEALAHLRDALWPQINHPDIPTIYPPGAQYLFQANAALGGGVAGLKPLIVAVEVTAMAVCWRWLREHWDRDRLLFAFAAYALNPLVFVEVAWSGHLDAVAWSLLIVGLVVWQHDDSARSGALSSATVGASASVKFLGLAALPLLVFDRGSASSHARPLWQRLAAPVAVLGVLVATYLPMADAGTKLFSGLGTYAASWRGNDGGYRVLHETTEGALHRWGGAESRQEDELFYHFGALDGLYRELGWTTNWKGKTVPDTTYSAAEIASIVGKAAAALVVGLALLWCLILGRRPLEGTALSLLALYLFAPVVHPWYVAWLVPFAALRRRATGLVFSFTVLAAYLAWRSAAAGGNWHVPRWAVAAEYGAVLLTFWLESSLRREGSPEVS
jgi:hypothetical protein